MVTSAALPGDATFVLSPLTGPGPAGEAGDSTDWELDVTQGSAPGSGGGGQHQEPGLYRSSRCRRFGV